MFFGVVCCCIFWYSMIRCGIGVVLGEEEREEGGRDRGIEPYVSVFSVLTVCVFRFCKHFPNL